MIDTFDALAKFGGDESANADTMPTNGGELAQVDLSAVINRLNDLENAVNEIRKQSQQTQPDPQPQNNDPQPQNNDPQPQSGE